MDSRWPKWSRGDSETPAKKGGNLSWGISKADEEKGTDGNCNWHSVSRSETRCQKDSVFWLEQLRGWWLYLTKFRKTGREIGLGGETKSLWDFQGKVSGVWGWEERLKTASMNLGVNVKLVIKTKEVCVRRVSEKRWVGMSSEEIWWTGRAWMESQGQARR